MDNFQFVRTAGVIKKPLEFACDGRPAVCYSQAFFKRHSEHVILQTGGSWGSAPGYYIGSEYAKPEPFYGWQGGQS